MPGRAGADHGLQAGMHAELGQDGLYAGTGGAAGHPIRAAISAVRSPAGSRASTSSSRRVRLARIQLAQVRFHPASGYAALSTCY